MPEAITKPCESCGTPVTKTARQHVQRKYWTCGRTCSALLRIKRGVLAPSWQPNRFRGIRETRPCVQCGKAITRYVTEANHATDWRCSRRCNLIVQQGQPRKRHGDTATCAVCGASFYRSPREILAGRRFCSADCASTGRRQEIVIKPCAQCGAEMRLRPSETRRAFCSWDCRVAAKYKHSLGRLHNGKPARLISDGYVKVWEPQHPRAVRGWVLEHILVVEQKLGRSLLPGEEVDHINLDRSDNRPVNLQALSKSAHRKKTGADTRKTRMTLSAKLAEYERRFGPIEG